MLHKKLVITFITLLVISVLGLAECVLKSNRKPDLRQCYTDAASLDINPS